MKTMKLLLALSLISIVISGCLVDNGRIAKSSTAGYDQYKNKTINVSVLTPKGWNTEVTMGGEYVITAPDPKRPQILIMSSPVEHLMNGASKSITLEAYKRDRLAFITEKNIGPELRVSTKKSSLANHNAYEISYSYLVKGDSQRTLVQETFTLIDGKIYQIQYYVKEDIFAKYQKELQVIKSSYRILR